MGMPVVFIGHSAEDLEEAKHLESAIAVSGLLPLRERDLNETGKGWKNSVHEGVLRSDVVLLLWSRHASTSPVVEFESNTALDSGKQIVLCQLDGTPPAPRLSSSRIIPFQDYEKGIPSLLGILGGSDPAVKDGRSSLKTLPPNMAKPEAATMATAGVALSEQATQGVTGSGHPSAAGTAFSSSTDLTGQQIGERYRVIRLLGRGGMGAVYQVHDNELDRDVALKVIRPEVAEDASVLWRFKREIQLSSTITHKNVLRVYDLGEGGGVKFLTMQYVAGEDLADLIKREGRLPIPRLIHLFRQICEGLAAAHEHGIMHRDMKPSNVMVDSEDRVYLTDFGLAKTVANTGLTQAGFVLGTPHYMSPEQVRGEKADLQSDIYSLGVILYEMTTGVLPFGGDTIYEVMMQRVQKPPKPPSEVNPDIPPFLEKVIKRCMAIEKAARYRDIGELLNDLDQGADTGRTTVNTKFVLRRTRAWAAAISWRKAASMGIAGAVLILVALLAIPPLRHRIFEGETTPKAAAHEPVTVLVADFTNRTGNPIFDSTFESVFNLALEGASFINAYSRGDALRIARTLSNRTEKLDEATAQRVAVNQGIGVVVGGLIDRQGSGYVISARAIQPITGRTIASAEVSAHSKDQLLVAAANAAATIRKGLGDDTSDTALRFATETLTAISLEAVHEYAKGAEALSNGKFDDGRRSFLNAINLDPNFGLAYAALASVCRNLGQLQESGKYAKLALAHIDSMTERERYRTRGFYYLLNDNQQQCVEEYSALIKHYPSDVAAHNNRALCEVDSRNIPQAVEDMQRAVKIMPKRTLYRTNLALYSAFAGDFQSAEREGRTLLQLDSSFAPGYVALAYGQLGQGQLAETSDTYRKLAQVSPFGASLAASGLADLALYEGRVSDAVTILEKGAAADLAAQNPDRAADKYAALAHVQAVRGNNRSAIQDAERALANSKSARIKFLAARVFTEGGELGKARELASELASELQIDRQAYGKLIEGEIALKEKDARQAIRLASDANRLLDTWIGRFDLGRAYLEAGAFVEADSEFDRCLKRRGEAVSLFLSLVPTYGYFPPVYYYQGRVREGEKSPGFAEFYKAYLDIRGKAGEDPLAAELTRHMNR